MTEHEMARFTPEQKDFLGEQQVRSNQRNPVRLSL